MYNHLYFPHFTFVCGLEITYAKRVLCVVATLPAIFMLSVLGPISFLLLLDKLTEWTKGLLAV